MSTNTPESSPIDATLQSFNVNSSGGGGEDVLLVEMTSKQKPSTCHFSPSCREQVLKNEIAWLELEIMRLEQHLISLYNNSYKQQKQKQKQKQPPLLRSSSSSTPTHTPPDRLSENIVKCISCIYYKLANPVSNNLIEIGTRTGGSSDSYSSSSSSSTLYSGIVYEDDDDNWSSPRCKKRRPYYGSIQVSNISSVDSDDAFQYAAKMLEKFKSLVQSLEKVNPSKMNREEKLAFWINIHNALAMHAHLAYDTRDRLKTSSFLKATYNVGGHCINAHIIQSSILGIRSHYSLPWLQTLLLPGNKFKIESTKHVYAIDYPEPLVHFALCSGTYSDPAVRVYRANTVFNDLKLAMEEFASASVNILKETKLVLPKIFSYYATDTSLDISALLKLICDYLPEEEIAITKFLNSSSNTPHEKYIRWSPQNSKFRYIIHRQLAQKIISSL